MPSKKVDTSKKEASEARSPSKRVAEPAEEAQAAEEGASSKRRKGLGVRVIGGRIYDSENGKTCHQCRQKTVDIMASCKAASGSRPCTQHFCAKCLFNRYGEKVTEVAELPSWSCPRCRGDCNCSICLKKQGCVPTGILAHTAKATGFTSVADLLKKRPAVKVDSADASVSSPPKGPQKKGSMKDENANPKSPIPAEKSGTPSKGSATKADSNWKKRKLVVTADGDVEGPVANVLLRSTSPFPAKQKKTPANSLQDVSSLSSEKKAATSGRHTSNGKKEKTSASKGILEAFLLSKPEKKVTFGEVNEQKLLISSQNDQHVKSEDGQVMAVKPKKAKLEKKNSVGASSEDVKPLVRKSNAKALKKEGKKVKKEPGLETTDGEGKLGSKNTVKKKDKSSGLGTLKNSKTEAKEPNKRNNPGKSMLSAYEEEEIVLPSGEPLTMVAGLDFPSEAIGPAAQLVEFCSAFQSVLGLRKGDAEAMLRELTKGRLVRKGPNSLLVQLHAKLLNMIESSSTESDGHVTQFSSGKKSWLNVLKTHLQEKSCMFSSLAEMENANSIQPDIVQPSVSSALMKEDLNTIKFAIEGGAEGYESLGVYHKLQLLVILCDDSLETQDMRDHMESVNREFSEAQRGNKEEVLAARKEVRDAKQKIKDAEVAKFLALGNINGPLTAEDKEALLSKVLAETERAVAAASLEKEAVSRMKKARNDAVRTDAIARGPDGQAFYKLKGVDNMNSVAVQECKAAEGQPGLDFWRVYSTMEEDVLTNFLLQRARICRRKMLSESTALEGSRIKGGDEEKENRVPNSVSVNVEHTY